MLHFFENLRTNLENVSWNLGKVPNNLKTNGLDDSKVLGLKNCPANMESNEPDLNAYCSILLRPNVKENYKIIGRNVYLKEKIKDFGRNVYESREGHQCERYES